MNAPLRIRRIRKGPFTPGLTAGLVAGVALNAAGLICIGATWRLPAPPPPERIFVTVGADTARAREFAELIDPSPLFLPTRLNHGSGAPRAAKGAPEEPPLPDNDGATAPQPPRIAMSRAETPRLTAEGVEGASIPDTFAAVGLRAPAAPPAGRPRCEITNEATGETREFAGIPQSREERPVAPAEFLVVIDAYGVQPPTLLKGTGDEVLDISLNAALARALREKQPAPGRYRVTLAP